MHLVYDENGNPVPHGKTESHSHAHSHEGGEQSSENLALLNYMIDHNEHHADELEELAGKWEQSGFPDKAAAIREGVAGFRKGNECLKKALEF